MRKIIENNAILFEYEGQKNSIDYIEDWEIEGDIFEIIYVVINEDTNYEKNGDFYSNFKSLLPLEIPENILFEFWKNRINSKKPLILEKVIFPFKTFSFVKVNNLFKTRFGFYKAEYSDMPERWESKSTLEYFIKNLRDISIKKENIEVFENEELLILEFTTNDLNINIQKFHNQIFKEVEFLVQKTESELLGLNNFKSFIECWEENKDSNDEKKWQNIIKKNSWIISQLFSSPLILLENEAFLGGKNISNSSGNIIDFVYQNQLNSNIHLIEIKTPMTELIGKKYRSTYQISNELSGSVNQLLNYRQSVMNEFHNLHYKSLSKFEATNPKSTLIIGKISELDEQELKAFELFRNELKNIQIVTFDEIYEKTNILLNLIKNCS